ncbi:MAG: hypothetical protein AAGE01_23590, partial [Pseudomonadota bacterium]
WLSAEGGVTQWAAVELIEPFDESSRLTQIDFGEPLLAIDAAPFPYGERYIVGLGTDEALVNAPPPFIPELDINFCTGQFGRCNFDARVDRPGFYVVELSTEQDRGSSWSVEFGSSDSVNGFVGGGVLAAGGAQPGFSSFAQNGSGPITFGVEEYSGQVARIEVTLLRIDGQSRTVAVGPVSIAPGERQTISSLEPGFYAVEVRSQAGDPEGRFGLELNGPDVELSGYGGRFNPGPTGTGFAGLFGSFERLRIDYGESRPRFTIDYFDPLAGRLRYFPRQAGTPPLASGSLQRFDDERGNQRLHFGISATRASSDGRFVAIQEATRDGNLTPRRQLRLLDLATGAQVASPLGELDFRFHRLAGVTADGTRAIFGRPRAGEQDPQVVVLATDTGELLDVHEAGLPVQFETIGMDTADGAFLVESVPTVVGTTSGQRLLWLDFSNGALSQVGLLPSHDGIGSLSRPDRLAILGTGTIATIDSSGFVITVIDARTGDSTRFPVQPPQRFGDSVVQLEGVALRPDGGAALLQVVERYPNLEEKRLSRIFEYTFDDNRWREIAPSDDPLAAHRSQPRYGADGSAVYFINETLLEDDAGGFATVRQLVSVQAEEQLVRPLEGSGFEVLPIHYGADASSLLVLLRGTAAPAGSNGVQDLYRWVASP